jgi:hypothetical protein
MGSETESLRPLIVVKLVHDDLKPIWVVPKPRLHSQPSDGRHCHLRCEEATHRVGRKGQGGTQQAARGQTLRADCTSPAACCLTPKRSGKRVNKSAAVRPRHP